MFLHLEPFRGVGPLGPVRVRGYLFSLDIYRSHFLWSVNLGGTEKGCTRLVHPFLGRIFSRTCEALASGHNVEHGAESRRGKTSRGNGLQSATTGQRIDPERMMVSRGEYGVKPRLRLWGFWGVYGSFLRVKIMPLGRGLSIFANMEGELLKVRVGQDRTG